MGSFGGGLETIGIEFDPRSILQGIARVNQDIEGLEGKTTSATNKLKSDWQGVSDLLLKVSDRSKNSADSYIRSLERQAAAVGKSGLDKLNAQMEQAIKNYGYSESAINRITSAYERLKKAQEPVENSGEKYKALGENFARFVEAPAESAKGAIGGLLEKAGPLGLALAGGATALTAIAAAGYEAAKSLGEYGTRIYDVEVKTGLSAKEVGQFGFAARAVGQDVSVVERTLRGLTAAIEDDSEKGQKARDVLRGFGVDVQGVRDGLVPTKELFSQISEGLNTLPNAWARNEAAITLFKKAGIDLIPFLQELNENLETAKGLQFASQADVDRFREYQKQVAEFSTEWDHLAIRLKEPLAATVLVTAKYLLGDNDPDKNALFEPGTLAKRRLTEGIIGQRLSKSEQSTHLQMTGQAEAAASAADTSATNAALARWGATKEGIESALSEAKKAESTALKELEDHNVAGIKHMQEAESKAAQAQTLLDAIRDRDKKPKDYFVGPVQGPEIIQQHDLDQMARESALARPLNPGNSLSDVKDWSDEYKEQQKDQESAQKATISFMKDMIKLQTGPGGEMAVAKEIYDLRMQTASSALEQYEAGLDFLKEQASIQETADKKHDEELKKQSDEIEKQQDKIAKTASGLFETLFTKPQDFGKKFGETLHTATIKPIAEGLGDITGKALQPLIYGSDGKSGIAGAFGGLFGKRGGDDPVKESNDVNTAATIMNTQAVMLMTGHLAAQLGVSTPSIPGGSGLPGMSAPSVALPSSGTGTRTISIPLPGGGAFSIPNFGGGGGAPSFEAGTTSQPYFGASAPLFGSAAWSSGISDYFGGGSGFAGSGFQGYGGYGRPGGAGMGAFGSTALSIAGTALGVTAMAARGAPSSAGAGSGADLPLGMQISPSIQKVVGSLGPGASKPNAAVSYGTQALGALKGSWSNLGPAFGIGQGGMQSDVPFADSDNPLGPQMSPGGSTTFNSVARSSAGGSIVASEGLHLAESGLTGNNRGTWGGTFEGTAGGAMVGFEYGGPIGAAIGAAVGFSIGVGEQLAGVVSPQNRVKRLVQSMYHISIPNKEADQIVALAKQKYGNQLGVAVRSPEVRQMLGLYAAGTGQSQNSLVSSTIPHGGSLAEQGGQLYQQATYQYGQPYTYQSNLPVLGGPVAGNYPNPGGGVTIQGLTLSVGDKGAADFLAGNVVTPDFVAGQYADAQASSNGRVQAAATMSQPGLIVG